MTREAPDQMVPSLSHRCSTLSLSDQPLRQNAESSQRNDRKRMSSCVLESVLESVMNEDSESMTQPAVSSQELRARTSYENSEKSGRYGTLQPLDRGVDAIELYDSRLYTLGRSASDQPDPLIDYSFYRLQKESPGIYKMLSKRHCSIERKNTDTVLCDLSRNGTFVNQELVGNGTSIVLKHGDAISLGHPNFFVFVYDEKKKMDYPEKLTEKYLVTNNVLGTGGYGKVVLAKLRACASRCVAIKCLAKGALSKRFSQAPASAKEINNEVSIMLNINHPNCMRFEEWIENDKYAFIVLEYVAGGELFDRITDPKYEGHGMGEKLTKFYAYQMLSAIEYLHANDITHRDIKPENILLVEKDEYTVAKLSDFGLSKRPGASSSMRTFCGTPSYIAPEMLENDNEAYTPAVDVWSLGVVLFTAICGYPPFSDGYDDMEMNEQIKKGRLIFTRVWKCLSLESQTIIRRMLRIAPGERISATSALARPWFDDDVKAKVAQVIGKYQSKFK